MLRRSKKLNLFLSLILSFSFCISLSSTVYAYETITCYYWFSDSLIVSKWLSTPTISYNKLNSNNNFPFEVSYVYAKNKWSNEGISSTSAGTSRTSNIPCYGGTRSQILAGVGLSIAAGETGATFGSSTLYKYINYSGYTKYLHYQSSASQTVCIVDNNRTEAQYKKTFCHELGHAFGWKGHSAYSTDVMYAYESSVTTLTYRDIYHLTQVY